MTMMLTPERLRQVVLYDPTSGAFTWLSGKRGRGCAVGQVAGRATERGYWRISIDGETFKAHRLAWLYMTGEWPSEQVDHINCDRSNNRWSNLRLASNSQNHANRPAPKSNSSGRKGVSWSRGRRKWQAYITKDGTRKHLGYFVSREEAACSYAYAASRLFGEYARVA